MRNLCSRAAGVDGHPDEADQGARLGNAGREGLLTVVDALSVHVAGPEDRQVPAGEPRQREPGEARSVPLVPGLAHVDGQPRALDELGDNLAAVRHMEVDRAPTTRAGRTAEGEVVGARVCEPVG